MTRDASEMCTAIATHYLDSCFGAQSSALRFHITVSNISEINVDVSKHICDGTYRLETLLMHVCCSYVKTLV